MKQFFKLTIPKPCSQSWSEMSRTGSGRYCESCNKCVSDFTNFSDQQLKDFFSNSTEKICGNFTQNQLDRLLIEQGNSKHRKFIPQLLVSATLTIGLGSNTDAKEIVPQSIQTQTEFKSQSDQECIPNSSSDRINYISGKIIDFDTKEPLPYVNVTIKGTMQVAISDVDGNIKLIFSDSLIGKEITLAFTSVGYEEKEMKLLIYELPITTEIHLKSSLNNFRGEVIIVSAYASKTTSFWNRIFHKKGKKTDCK